MTIGTNPGWLLVVLLCAVIFIADRAAVLRARHTPKQAVMQTIQAGTDAELVVDAWIAAYTGTALWDFEAMAGAAPGVDGVPGAQHIQLSGALRIALDHIAEAYSEARLSRVAECTPHARFLVGAAPVWRLDFAPPTLDAAQQRFTFHIDAKTGALIDAGQGTRDG